MTTDWRVVSCEGKFKFDSWQQADDVRKARGRRNDSADKRQVYRCEFCHGFHLGTPIKKNLRRQGGAG